MEWGDNIFNADGSATTWRSYKIRYGGDGKYKSFHGWFEPTNDEGRYGQCMQYFSSGYTIEAGSAIPAGANVNIDYNTGEFTITSDEGMDLVEGDEIVKATFTLSASMPFDTYLACSVDMKNDYVMLNGTEEINLTTGWVSAIHPINKNKSQEISYDEDVIFKNSTDDDFTNPLTETTVVGVITYSSSDESVAIVDPTTGVVHIVGDGFTTITATAAAAYDYKSTSTSYDLYVDIQPVSIINASVPDKSYDGTTESEVGTVTLSDSNLVQGVDYTATAVFDDANVGTDKTVTVTVTLIGDAADNYTLTSNTTTVDNVTISPYSITSSNITLEYYTIGCDMSEKEPGVTVKIGDFTVDENEYTVGYRDNINPGTAYVTVTAKNNTNIVSEAEKTFEIVDGRNILEIMAIFVKEDETIVVPDTGRFTNTEIRRDACNVGAIVASALIAVATMTLVGGKFAEAKIDFDKK